jgi:hypothetical protein
VRGVAQNRYAVVFSEGDGTPVAGSLELREERLLLTGTKADGVQVVSVSTELTDVRIAERAERLNGLPTLVLSRGDLPTVQVAPYPAGLLREVLDLVALLPAAPGAGTDVLAVVVPLNPGCLEQVRALLALGPPIDPASLGLTGHHVHLNEQEAVFVFAGPDVRTRLAKAVRDPALWRAGLAWKDCIAGRPRITNRPHPGPDETPAFGWTASHEP